MAGQLNHTEMHSSGDLPERLEEVRKELVKNLDDGFSPRDKSKMNLLLELIDDEMVEEYNKGMVRARKVTLSRRDANHRTKDVTLSRRDGNSFNQRRSEIEVLASMLLVACKGVNKTKILYRANLSYSQLKNYLHFLMEKGLIEVNSMGMRNTYTTTAKGLSFLTAWKKTFPFLE